MKKPRLQYDVALILIDMLDKDFDAAMNSDLPPAYAPDLCHSAALIVRYQERAQKIERQAVYAAVRIYGDDPSNYRKYIPELKP